MATSAYPAVDSTSSTLSWMASTEMMPSLTFGSKWAVTLSPSRSMVEGWYCLPSASNALAMAAVILVTSNSAIFPSRFWTWYMASPFVRFCVEGRLRDTRKTATSILPRIRDGS